VNFWRFVKGYLKRRQSRRPRDRHTRMLRDKAIYYLEGQRVARQHIQNGRKAAAHGTGIHECCATRLPIT